MARNPRKKAKSHDQMAKYRQLVAVHLDKLLPGAEFGNLSCRCFKNRRIIECPLLKTCIVFQRNRLPVCCELTDQEADIKPLPDKHHVDAWLSRLHEPLRQEEDVLGLTLDEASELLGWEPWSNK